MQGMAVYLSAVTILGTASAGKSSLGQSHLDCRWDPVPPMKVRRGLILSDEFHRSESSPRRATVELNKVKLDLGLSSIHETLPRQQIGRLDRTRERATTNMDLGFGTDQTVPHDGVRLI